MMDDLLDAQAIVFWGNVLWKILILINFTVIAIKL